MSTDYNTSYYADEDYDDGGRSSGRHNIKVIILIAVCVMGIIAVAVYTRFLKKNTYTSYEKVTAYPNIADAKCIGSDAGFVLYNCDGAEGHNTDGSVAWKISYDYSNPIGAVCGNYAAFADRGAREVRITDGLGANYVVNVSDKIEDICVAAQGVTAIRTDSGDTDHIYLYDVNGNELMDIKTDVRGSGFPVTMALSSDARKLVTSYLKAGQNSESRVTFYNFGDVGQNYSDKVVGSYTFENTFIPDVRFVSDERVLVTGGNKSVLYKFREVPEEIKRYEFDSEIASVASCKEGFCLAVSKSGGMKSITLYNLSGSAEGTIETGMNYDGIFRNAGELIVTAADTCIIYTDDGSEKFRSRMDNTIEFMYPQKGTSNYTIVGAKDTIIIRLKTKSEENQGFEPLE